MKRKSKKTSSISPIVFSIWLMRIILGSMLIFLIFKFWMTYDRTKDVYGKSKIWDKEYSLILSDDIERFYINPQKYIEYNRQRAQSLLDIAWQGTNPKVRFLPMKYKKTENGIDWSDTNSAPVVTFYYDEEGERDVDCNVKFVDQLAARLKKRGKLDVYHRNRRFIENSAKFNLINSLKRFRSYSAREDSTRRAQSDVVFSYKEMTRLKLNAGVMFTMIPFVLETDEFRPDSSRGIDSSGF
ncbi:MAG: hypothetical protein P9X24_12685 [Candidatus Hatepunaea meridiana]|nr:hypothetical protein [Candidatus Hatepunaea meridiana]